MQICADELPTFFTNLYAYRSTEVIITAQIQVVAVTRTFTGETIATNRSKAIKTRLTVETVKEARRRKLTALRDINPARPPMGHCTELDSICANLIGRTVIE